MKNIFLIICLSMSIALAQPYVVLNDTIILAGIVNPHDKLPFSFMAGTLIWIDSTKKLNNETWQFVRTSASLDPEGKHPVAGWVKKLEYADSSKFLRVTNWKYENAAGYCIGDYCPEFKISSNGSVKRLNVPYEIQTNQVKADKYNGKCPENIEKWNGKACEANGHAYIYRNILWVKISGWNNDDFFAISKIGKLCSGNCCRFNEKGECKEY